MIPMVDLKKQFENIKDELIAEIVNVLESTRYVLGPKVAELEEKVALYTGSGEAVGVASGTDALHLSIKALGVGEGDEVITTPFTFFATIEAILYEGAKPVFVDVDRETFNVDVSSIEKAITAKTKAILPVHMFGHPADMEAISKLAEIHKLKVIEDCAQAFGASIDGKVVGSFGDAGSFSFYPSKNLGAYGDGGMITIKDHDIAAEIRKLRNHGSRGNYLHEDVGFNSRLDEIQAAILLVKFKRIDEYNAQRRKKAVLYNKLLSEKVACPIERNGCYHVYHQYTIMSPKRGEIQNALEREGIASTVYYPLPLHLQPALKFMGYKEGDFPVAEQVAKEVLSLPICPELEDEAIQRTAETILSV